MGGSHEKIGGPSNSMSQYRMQEKIWDSLAPESPAHGKFVILVGGAHVMEIWKYK